MTQIENKVKWCIEKAKKELQESRKHRGLIKTNPNSEEARKHIEKAEHNLKAISYFNNGGYSDWSISAGFYSIYHCFLAICCKFGYESRNQECTLVLIRYLKGGGKIDLEDKFMDALESYDEKERHESNIVEKREFYTYGTTISAENSSEIEESKTLCKECLEQTKKIVLS